MTPPDEAPESLESRTWRKVAVYLRHRRAALKKHHKDAPPLTWEDAERAIFERAER